MDPCLSISILSITECAMVFQPLTHTLFLSLSHIVAHRLSEDFNTEALKAIEGGGKNPLLPTDVEGLNSMMDFTFYQSDRLKFHRRMSEALLDERLPRYDYFKESKLL